MLSGVFFCRAILPEVSSFSWLHDLIRSFKFESCFVPIRPPSFDVELVLRALHGGECGPMTQLFF